MREAGVAAVMTSYNRLNGHYLADNHHILSTVLRGARGFDGIVMTDWWAWGAGPLAGNGPCGLTQKTGSVWAHLGGLCCASRDRAGVKMQYHSPMAVKDRKDREIRRRVGIAPIGASRWTGTQPPDDGRRRNRCGRAGSCPL